MFYSHQLLARKAPLGKIWMAATMHAKLNRKKLDQIDLIRICEEILNPSVPMALRLSGILMGGVVIVYERKVKILYDDVNRLLVEINSAWKVKPAVDPTVLPKSKNQAKFEAVTLPENNDADLNDVEQSIDYSNRFASNATFQHTAYFAMRLDTIDELSESFRGKEPNEGHHQADPANITLDDPFDSYQADPSLYNRFERFDIEGDEESQNNFTSQRRTDAPPATVHSPPPELRRQGEDNVKNTPTADDVPGKHPVDQANLSSPQLKEERQQPQQHIQKRKLVRKKARKSPSIIMDNEQIMIPSNMYQSWLQDSADIRVKGQKMTEPVSAISTVKLVKLLNLPPVALSCGLISKSHEVHYPQPLLDLWTISMQPLQDSPSGTTSSPHPPEPSSSSPPRGQKNQDPPEILVGGFGNNRTSERLASLEKLRSNLATGTEIPVNELNLMFNDVGTTNLNASGSNSGPGLDLSNTSGSYSEQRPQDSGTSSSTHRGVASSSSATGQESNDPPHTPVLGSGSVSSGKSVSGNQLSIEMTKKRSRSSSSENDYFCLALTVPQAFFLLDDDKKEIFKHNRDNVVLWRPFIHGLRRIASHHEYYEEVRFDLREISHLQEREIRDNWTCYSLFTDVDFYYGLVKHEYEKHGPSVGLVQKEYVDFCLREYMSLGVANILNEMGSNIGEAVTDINGNVWGRINDENGNLWLPIIAYLLWSRFTDGADGYDPTLVFRMSSTTGQNGAFFPLLQELHFIYKWDVSQSYLVKVSAKKAGLKWSTNPSMQSTAVVYIPATPSSTMLRVNVPETFNIDDEETFPKLGRCG